MAAAGSQGQSRTCTRCGEELPITAFAMRSGRGSPQAWCRPCKRAYDRDWYRQNKDRHAEVNREARSRFKARARHLVTQAKSVPCADCGNSYPPHVMDFDHVRGRKVLNVGLMSHRVSLDTLQSEIDKCEVVCANCHRERTHMRRRQTPPE